MLEDDRWKALFERSDFAIDEESAEFRLVNPRRAATSKQSGRRKDDVCAASPVSPLSPVLFSLLLYFCVAWSPSKEG